MGKGSIGIDLEDGAHKVIGITRAHLEEDAGKSLHEDFHGMSGIDLNRTGTPAVGDRFRTGYALHQGGRGLRP